MKIYHNPRCKKSRTGLAHLQTKTSDIQIVTYLSDAPFTEESLKAVLTKLGKSPLEMCRKQEAAFKEHIKGKDLSDNELIRLMAENPKLINRPIIETDTHAVWGDPPSEIDSLF